MSAPGLTCRRVAAVQSMQAGTKLTSALDKTLTLLVDDRLAEMDERIDFSEYWQQKIEAMDNKLEDQEAHIQHLENKAEEHREHINALYSSLAAVQNGPTGQAWTELNTQIDEMREIVFKGQGRHEAQLRGHMSRLDRNRNHKSLSQAFGAWQLYRRNQKNSHVLERRSIAHNNRSHLARAFAVWAAANKQAKKLTEREALLALETRFSSLHEHVEAKVSDLQGSGMSGEQEQELLDKLHEQQQMLREEHSGKSQQLQDEIESQSVQMQEEMRRQLDDMAKKMAEEAFAREKAKMMRDLSKVVGRLKFRSVSSGFSTWKDQWRVNKKTRHLLSKVTARLTNMSLARCIGVWAAATRVKKQKRQQELLDELKTRTHTFEDEMEKKLEDRKQQLDRERKKERDAMEADVDKRTKELDERLHLHSNEAVVAQARPATTLVFAPRSVRRLLLTLQVNPGSLYRCGKSD